MRDPKKRSGKSPKREKSRENSRARELTIAERSDARSRRELVDRIAKETKRAPQTVARWLRGGKEIPKAFRDTVARAYSKSVTGQSVVLQTPRERAEREAQRALFKAEQERIEQQTRAFARRHEISEKTARDYGKLTPAELDLVFRARDHMLGNRRLQDGRSDTGRASIERYIRNNEHKIQALSSALNVSSRQIKNALFSPPVKKSRR